MGSEPVLGRGAEQDEDVVDWMTKHRVGDRIVEGMLLLAQADTLTQDDEDEDDRPQGAARCAAD